MAEEDKRRSYPSIPSWNWWDLRARFKQSIPGKVDADYIQAVLGVGQGHAKNLIPQLIAVGLIGDDGKPCHLAMDWRDDTTYPEACQKIRESKYPQGIRDALPPPNPDRTAVEQWFMRNAKVGEGAAGKMATFYLLLSASDVSQADGVRKRETKPKAATAKAVPARSARAGTRRTR